MTNCIKCKSKRLLKINAKCNDLFSASFLNKDYLGYVIKNIGIGDTDYINFTYCLDCGQIQDKFPIDFLENYEKIEKKEINNTKIPSNLKYTHSIKPHYDIKSGIYTGFRGGYILNIKIDNKLTEDIKLNNGIRCISKQCSVKVRPDGWIEIL